MALLLKKDAEPRHIGIFFNSTRVMLHERNNILPSNKGRGAVYEISCWDVTTEYCSEESYLKRRMKRRQI